MPRPELLRSSRVKMGEIRSRRQIQRGKRTLVLFSIFSPLGMNSGERNESPLPPPPFSLGNVQTVLCSFFFILQLSLSSQDAFGALLLTAPLLLGAFCDQGSFPSFPPLLNCRATSKSSPSSCSEPLRTI